MMRRIVTCSVVVGLAGFLAGCSKPPVAEWPSPTVAFDSVRDKVGLGGAPAPAEGGGARRGGTRARGTNTATTPMGTGTAPQATGTSTVPPTAPTAPTGTRAATPGTGTAPTK